MSVSLKSSLGLTNGNIVIGRRDRKVDDGSGGGGGFTGTMSEALDRFENGIMMVSAIRHDADCAERFACREAIQ